MVKALHDTIASLREQVSQGLTREDDWKKREQKWEKREESWNSEREALIKLIQYERDTFDEKEVTNKMTEIGVTDRVNAKRQVKAAEKAEVMLQRVERSTAEELDGKFESKEKEIM